MMDETVEYLPPTRKVPLSNFSIQSSSSSSRADSTDFSDSLSLSLSIRPYHPSLPTGLPEYTLSPLRADVNKFFWSANTGTPMCMGP